MLVYGDLCLGMNGEMRRLADEYGVAKIEALNCIDCQLGGGGKSATEDPEHNLMFMGPGMIDFFVDMRRNLEMQGVDEATVEGMFSGIKGAIVLDTLGNPELAVEALDKAGLKLKVLEVREIGCENILKVVEEAAHRSPTKNPETP